MYATRLGQPPRSERPNRVSIVDLDQTPFFLLGTCTWGQGLCLNEEDTTRALPSQRFFVHVAVLLLLRANGVHFPSFGNAAFPPAALAFPRRKPTSPTAQQTNETRSDRMDPRVVPRVTETGQLSNTCVHA